MSQRVAVLMKLRDGVTKAEVRELCDLLRRIGEPSWLRLSKTEWRDNPVLGDKRPHLVDGGAKPDEAIVRKYDDQHGDPSFYIP